MTSARVLAAAFNLVIGIRLLIPDDILGSVPGYRLMYRHFLGPWAGDAPLGVVCLALGAAMTAGLYSDRWSSWVKGATFLSMLTWGLVAIDLTIANPSQLGTFSYGLAAVLNIYAYSHLADWLDQLERARRALENRSL